MNGKMTFLLGSLSWARMLLLGLILALLALVGLNGNAPQARASGGMPSAIFDLDSVSWYSVRNLTSAAFSDYFNERVEEGYMLIDYEVTEIGGQQRVSGVFQANVDGRDWIAQRNLTSAEFSDIWSEYSENGFRLIEQDGYVLNGQLLYSLIMIENVEGLDWISRRNLTSEQFSEEFDLYKDNYIPVDIEAYPYGNSTRYAIIWVENVENLDWIELRDLTFAEMNNRAQEYDENYRLHDLEAYLRNGNQNYAGIWIENKNGRDYLALAEMTAQQYADTWQEKWDAGYRVTDFEVYDTPEGQKRYAAVWRQNSIRPDWQHKDYVDNLLETFANDFDLPGMSVAVAKGNTFLYLRGFGFADIDDGKKASSQTVYRLASVSKAIAGVLALDLQEEGVIDLNEDTLTYVSTMPAHQTHKVWQLVANRAGVGHYGDYDNVSPTMYGQYNWATTASSLFWNEPLPYGPPGTQEEYSTPGYTLLGAAIEGAIGYRFPISSVVEEELNQKYSLPTLQAEDRSQPTPERSAIYRWIGGQNVEWDNPDNISWKVLGGGLEASAYDISRLGIKLLNGSILSDDSLSTLWTPPDSLSNYAYGWDTAVQECAQLVGKPGGQWGADSYFRMYPEFDITIVVLTNRWQGGHSAAAVSREIGQVMLEEECNDDPEILQFRGLQHISIGSAKLSSDGDRLVVNNIGFRGRDGVSIDLNLARSWEAKMLFDFSSRGRSVFTAKADDRDVTTLALAGAGDTLSILPDFGGKSYQVVYLNGEEIVGQTKLPGGSPAAQFNWDEIWCLVSGVESFICKLIVEYGPDAAGGEDAWSLVFEKPVSINLSGGAVLVDQMKLVGLPEKQQLSTSQSSSLTSIEVLLSHVNSVVFENESARASESMIYLPVIVR